MAALQALPIAENHIKLKFMTQKPAWAIENYLDVKNGRLSVGGVDCVELAEKFETPLFVFSEARIRHNIDRLKAVEKAIEMPLKICYAAKANSNMAILRTVRENSISLETNSGGELFKALKVGFAPGDIILNGTSKSEEELEQAITAGIYAIQADSLFEVELIESVARKINKKANVSLRLVPEIATDTLHGLQTAMLTSKFGMLAAEVLAAFRRWHNSELLNLCGIHLHLGSQNPDGLPYTEAFIKLFDLMAQIFDETGKRLTHLNLGGGFPVNYLRDTSNAGVMTKNQQALFAAELDPAQVLEKAVGVVRGVAKDSGAGHLLEGLTILLEPGRSVISDAGLVLTKVRNRKQRPLPDGAIDSWLLTDAGYNIMLSMNNYDWYYHCISASRADVPHQTKYKIAGPLCDGGDVYFDIEGGDKLPDHRLLPENVDTGEILAMLNCGAYSLAQMFPYNGRPLPAAILVRENGEVELIRKRDSYELLIESDIW
jgi:diaminopimelate decarboxylase